MFEQQNKGDLKVGNPQVVSQSTLGWFLNLTLSFNSLVCTLGVHGP